ncbi:MAG: sugar phosphate nucleotidyltransferase [Acidobacteria bacterium]|nr:sugar phosphate nucleotidyltransferase [Acidobacteriota bacterium]
MVAEAVAIVVDEPVVGIVLARGLGSRMRAAQPDAVHPLTPAQRAAAAAGNKGMMPLTGADGRERPFLDWVLSAMADAGFTDVALVVAPSPSDGTADPLREYYTGRGTPRRLRLSFVVQAAPRGTADAVVAAAVWIAGRAFVVLNADNRYDTTDLRALREAPGPALPVYTRAELVARSGIAAERVAAFALLQITPDGDLADIVEKPDAALMASAGPQALISMNCWRGDTRVIQACRDVALSARGEFELPAAMRLAITRGVRIRAIPATGPVLDLSRQDDVAGVVARLQAEEAHP